MIVIACLKCSMALRTSGDPAEVHTLLGQGSEWYPDKYPCPRDGCPGPAEYCMSIDSMAFSALEVHDVTPQEAFAALEGLGLPPERDCGETAVRAALEKKITGAGTRQIRGMSRTVIEWLEFEDGTRMYLASSAEGAVAYRLSKPFSYAEKTSG